MKSAAQGASEESTHQKWIPLLETATREVFDLMLSSRLTVPTTAGASNLGVTSMVGLAGKLCGVMTVRCDEKAAILMASKMLSLPLESVGQDFSDALGEVCNMVAGNFKNKIAGLSDGCMLSPPSVITGSDYSLHSLGDSHPIEIRLLFEDLPIIVSLKVHS
jgi:chemotaxis protein CheX